FNILQGRGVTSVGERGAPAARGPLPRAAGCGSGGTGGRDRSGVRRVGRGAHDDVVAVRATGAGTPAGDEAQLRSADGAVDGLGGEVRLGHRPDGPDGEPGCGAVLQACLDPVAPAQPPQVAEDAVPVVAHGDVTEDHRRSGAARRRGVPVPTGPVVGRDRGHLHGAVRGQSQPDDRCVDPDGRDPQPDRYGAAGAARPRGGAGGPRCAARPVAGRPGAGAAPGAAGGQHGCRRRGDEGAPGEGRHPAVVRRRRTRRTPAPPAARAAATPPPISVPSGPDEVAAAPVSGAPLGTTDTPVASSAGAGTSLSAGTGEGSVRGASVGTGASLVAGTGEGSLAGASVGTGVAAASETGTAGAGPSADAE